MSNENFHQNVADALARGITAKRGKDPDQGGIYILNWVSVYTFMDDAGQKSYGWAMSPDIRTYEVRGMLEEMLTDINTREVVKQIIQVAGRSHPEDDDEE